MIKKSFLLSLTKILYHLTIKTWIDNKLNLMKYKNLQPQYLILNND